MADFFTKNEEEQVEDLKKWWKENGKSIIAGLVIGIGAVVGWRGYNDYRENQAQKAAGDFEQLLGSVQQGRTESVMKAGDALKNEYRSTPYAGLAALAMAKVAVEQGDHELAKEQLAWVVDHGGSEEMRTIARLRLARVWFQLGEIDAALALLEGFDANEFVAAYEELRGDLYRAKGQLEKALDAYQKALLANTQTRELVQMKIDDLGHGAGEVGGS